MSEVGVKTGLALVEHKISASFPSPRNVEMNGQAVIAIPSPVLSRPQLQRRSATWKIKGDLYTISQR